MVPALAVIHNQDLGLLQATEPSVEDRATICAINIDMFRESLALDAPANAQVMRFMLISE